VQLTALGLLCLDFVRFNSFGLRLFVPSS